METVLLVSRSHEEESREDRDQSEQGKYNLSTELDRKMNLLFFPQEKQNEWVEGGNFSIHKLPPV